MLIAEAGAIAVLAAAAYIMSHKDKLSLEKKALRNEELDKKFPYRNKHKDELADMFYQQFQKAWRKT